MQCMWAALLASVVGQHAAAGGTHLPTHPASHPPVVMAPTTGTSSTIIAGLML